MSELYAYGCPPKFVLSDRDLSIGALRLGVECNQVACDDS